MLSAPQEHTIFPMNHAPLCYQSNHVNSFYQLKCIGGVTVILSRIPSPTLLGYLYTGISLNFAGHHSLGESSKQILARQHPTADKDIQSKSLFC